MKPTLSPSIFIVLLIFLALFQIGPVYAEVEMEDFATFNKPVGLAWTSSGFIASSRNDETKLVTISLDGKTVEPFAPSFSGEGEVYIAISHGKAGFPEEYIYVSSGNSIYKIDPSGSDVKLFSTPFEEMGLGYIAFDTVGTWDHLLYAVNYNGLLWAIDSGGNANLIVDLGNDLLPESIAVAPEDFGDFGGDLIISLEMGRKVIAISDEDPSQVTVLAEFPGESPERVLVIPADSNLYLAKYEENVVVKIPAGHFSGYVGGLVVITEGEAGEPGSITLLQADEGVITIVKMAEGIENPHFEGAVFVPVTATSTVTTVMTVQAFSLNALLIIGVTVVAVVILAVVFVMRRRGRKE
ncbi:MAG: hypothetical protein ACE5KU_01020 [Nitrososphaerales archaeon]